MTRTVVRWSLASVFGLLAVRPLALAEQPAELLDQPARIVGAPSNRVEQSVGATSYRVEEPTTGRALTIVRSPVSNQRFLVLEYRDPSVGSVVAMVDSDGTMATDSGISVSDSLFAAAWTGRAIPTRGTSVVTSNVRGESRQSSYEYDLAVRGDQTHPPALDYQLMLRDLPEADILASLMAFTDPHSPAGARTVFVNGEEPVGGRMTAQDDPGQAEAGWLSHVSYCTNLYFTILDLAVLAARTDPGGLNHALLSNNVAGWSLSCGDLIPRGEPIPDPILD